MSKMRLVTKGRLLTSAEVAERARVSVRTVARWVEDGKLEAAQRLPGLRGAHLFRQEKVERFLSTRAAA